MRRIDLEEVETITWPADGVTDYGGWMMPLGWDVREATLEVVEPEVPRPTICRYSDAPCSLMLSSAPTPPGGLTGRLRVVPEADLHEQEAGESVAGCFVLIADGRPSMRQVTALFRNGAIGVLSFPHSAQSQPVPVDADLVRWHNFTIPPWDIPDRGIGFSLSRRQAERLLRLTRCGAEVVLKAKVDARFYKGALPLVTGVLKGETDEEIAYSCHLFEQGANDNATGVAAGLSILKMLNDLIAERKVRRPRRSIRLVFTHEVRSLQAFANTRRLEGLVAAVNPDMVGTPRDADFYVQLNDSSDILPSYAGPLLQRLITDGAGLDPVRRLSRLGCSDNVFADPGTAVPCPTVITWEYPFWHTSFDVAEQVSEDVLRRIGVAVGTYCWFLADADKEEALWLARLTADDRKTAFLGLSKDLSKQVRQADLTPAQARECLDFHTEGSRRALQSVIPLVPKSGEYDADTGLSARAAVGQALDSLSKDLAAFCRAESDRMVRLLPRARSAGVDELTAAERERLAAAVPLRTFHGFFSLEKYLINSRVPEPLRPVNGWSAPRWVNYMLFWSNGRRTLLDIHRMLRSVGQGVLGRTLHETFEFLRDEGYVRARPVIRQADVKEALLRLGLGKGDMVFAHTSLSWPGYVAGGPDTVIDGLLDVIGPEGTLAAPTFTFSRLGAPPFCRDDSPSRVGIISETLRRRDGARRSGHPTHSVAALGKRAAWLVRRHPPTENPFVEGGPFRKLYRENAIIIMLCRPGPNTCMHVGELWAGAAIPENVKAHLIDNGKRRVVTIRSVPLHTTAFDRIYAMLRERNQIRETPLGEKPILAMRARDVIDASVEVMHADPFAVVAPDCTCDFCRKHRPGRRDLPAG